MTCTVKISQLSVSFTNLRLFKQRRKDYTQTLYNYIIASVRNVPLSPLTKSEELSERKINTEQQYMR